MNAPTTTPPDPLETPLDEIPVVDPERDINARVTVTWVLAWTVVLIISLWLLLVLFKTVLFEERRSKIELTPAIELEELLEQEKSYLSGQGEGAPKKTIEEVMADRVRRGGR